ncbi:uncharacterized protein B0H18DRAFT_1116506 [Fomitopsis serialis]|uniref:uncharacterized protein n=1 Tax=Fomitopsis serialis TaxID=139415 RepID=UPI0020073F19|nr:uncharacterized protein B0H18DRAFT_1116506 [Neoantrodia serialis]KAH9931349.1 hypothetical protein B0H18DRAFT_1116506 [Neoantrodia serialis]
MSSESAPPTSTTAIIPQGTEPAVPAPSSREGIVKKLEKKGARFGLEYDMFRSVQAIIDAGRARDPEAPSSVYTSWEQKLHKLYDSLTAIAPELRDELTIRGPTGSPEVAEMIERGRTRDRNNIVNTCKGGIRDWITFNPPLPTEKQFRGFSCESTGQLLCPVMYDYGDARVRVALLEYHADYPQGADDYPAFLWRDNTADKTNFFRGFCEGLLICKGLQHILVAPSVAKSNDGVTSRSNRKGRAQIHGIRTVTPAMIAYIACIVHFSLSSQVTFGAGSEDERGKFWYEGFYNSLIRTIEDVMPEELRTALLSFHSIRVLSAIQADAATSGTRRINSVAHHMALAQASTSSDVPSV